MDKPTIADSRQLDIEACVLELMIRHHLEQAATLRERLQMLDLKLRGQPVDVQLMRVRMRGPMGRPFDQISE